MKGRRQTGLLVWHNTLALLLTILMAGCAPFGQTTKLDNLSPQTTENLAGKAAGTVMPKGTKVDDLDLSAAPVSEVPVKLEKWAQDKLEETRVLMYNGTEIPMTLREMGIALDTQKTIERIQHFSGTAQPSVLKVDPVKASQMLQEKLPKFNRPAKDASYKIQNDQVVITPAESGRVVAPDQLISNLAKAPLSKVPQRIMIPVTEVPALVATETLRALAFDTVIGEFTTKFAVQEKNRSANLIAAAKAVDHKIIRPGETFSFNDTVGPREPETGYKDAYVILNGEYVEGTGGGVCQVSSTLYNAVLLADLDIVERMPHAIAVNYVPPGQDATVDYPHKIDFKFKNNTTSLVYIRADIQPGTLTFRIWGKKTGKSVHIERQIIKKIAYKTEQRFDPKLRPGRVVQEQAGSQGIVVDSWKVIQDAEGVGNKQFLGRDSYAPTNRILRVGRRKG